MGSLCLNGEALPLLVSVQALVSVPLLPRLKTNWGSQGYSTATRLVPSVARLFRAAIGRSAIRKVSIVSQSLSRIGTHLGTTSLGTAGSTAIYGACLSPEASQLQPLTAAVVQCEYPS
jgi:hypothetical protein